MPELPEVQTTVAGIKPYLIDTMIERLVIRQPQLRWPVTQGIEDTAKGLKIENVSRRAKYILVSLTFGSFLIHLGDEWKSSINYKCRPFKNMTISKCTYPMVMFLLSMILDDSDVGYGEDDHVQLEKLGPEPLSSNFR